MKKTLKAMAGQAAMTDKFQFLLGGSWVLKSGVISPPIWVITIVILLITLEPPSCGY